jgi:hypothetical protein
MPTVKLGLIPLIALLAAAMAQPATAASLDVLGAYDPASPGFNASAVGLDGIGYLGSWGSANQCPSLGVRVIDIRDPANASLLSVAASYPRTTAEHLAVVRMATESFAGNVLFAGIQRCSASNGAPAGLAIWDVTDPANPQELGFASVGRSGRGVHEFTVRQRNNRWYAYLAVPNSEINGGPGDLRIIDVTDPRNPVELADWGARRDAGVPVGISSDCSPACRGTVPQAFLHSVALSPDGRTAYLSYWDQGVIVLDVSDPASPVWLGQFVEPRAAEGNTHSVSITPDGRLALVADETGTAPWGHLRLVDVHDPTSPLQIGVFETAESAAGIRGSDEYAFSIHNPLADDRDSTRAYLAWYEDGVRLLNIADPTAPAEVAAWLPPRAPFVWNVAFMGDEVIVGDVNNGLFVLQR